MKFTFVAVLLALVCTSCWRFGNNYPDFQDRKVMGFKPVYSNDPALLRIYTDDVREVKNAGKIYTINNFIFQNEIGSGLHVFDYSNPAQPKKAGFINIPGNTELSVKGNFIYANSYADLVVINITDWRNASETKRLKDAFKQGLEQNYSYSIPPPEHGVYYECMTRGKGVHTGWIKDSVSSYGCYYQ
jgi:hypothetical protein